MGQRVPVQKQQWRSVTAVAQANLRAGGCDIREPQAGHDVHQLSPIGSTVGAAHDGNPKAEQDGRERENSGTSLEDSRAVSRKPGLPDIAYLARIEPPSTMHCRTVVPHHEVV